MNLNNFTIKSQEIFSKAQQIAFNGQNPNIETEHLLKALLSDDDSPVDFLLKKNNVNVNFVESTGEDSIFVRTYERGVEDETMSCGTGVTAAALMSAHNERGFNRVEIKTPGGHLSVEFNKLSDQSFNDIWLCGPATFVYKGEIEI